MKHRLYSKRDVYKLTNTNPPQLEAFVRSMVVRGTPMVDGTRGFSLKDMALIIGMRELRAAGVPLKKMRKLGYWWNKTSYDWMMVTVALYINTSTMKVSPSPFKQTGHPLQLILFPQALLRIVEERLKHEYAR